MQSATKSSQFSPAATVTRPPSIATPRLAIRTTVPRNPSSATTRFDPPDITSSGSAADATASTISSSVVPSIRRSGGPPRRRVVSSENRMSIRSCTGRDLEQLDAPGEVDPGGVDHDVIQLRVADVCTVEASRVFAVGAVESFERLERLVQGDPGEPRGLNRPVVRRSVESGAEHVWPVP